MTSAGAGDTLGEFQSFVTDLAQSVSDHRQSGLAPLSNEGEPPARAFDDTRMAWEWPDPVGRVIEELR